jgi:glycosyltransferase involved in cell wall biosynthesis
MNIIFILKTVEIGGLEVVTTVLANKFVSEGHNVSIFAFCDAEHSIECRLDKRIHIHKVKKLKCNAENVATLKSLLIEEKVQIIINQWGLPFFPLKTAKKAAKGLDVKFISVYHNTPDMNGKIQSVNDQLANTSKTLLRLLLKMKGYVVKQITSYGMRWNYNNSDRYMVLSPSFIDKFKAFTGIKNPIKLIVQTNPVTIDVGDFSLDLAKKQKEILYVGRLDNNQKKVNRIIETWAKLEARYLDWKLTIIGDGPSKIEIEQQVKKLNLERVYFEGFQSPRAYYERASILILTSDFEGFGLVVVEAMCFGVVPVILGSYSAIYDIVTDNANGCILPFDKKNGFNADTMALKLSELMSLDLKYIKMSQAALERSKHFSINNIYAEWKALLNDILR